MVLSAYSAQDHFLLVGPSEAINPAGLDEQNDDALKMFSKIVVTGNAHATVSFCFTSILHCTKQAFWLGATCKRDSYPIFITLRQERYKY